MKITKRQLRRIIKEEKQKLLQEQPIQMQDDQNQPMYQIDDELRELGDLIGDISHGSSEVEFMVHEMSQRYGELVHLNVQARMLKNAIKKLSDDYNKALKNIGKQR